nr:M15 family metallopeptidase [uncultured Oscillibacter sp.]
MKIRYFSAALVLALTIAAPTAGAVNLAEESPKAQETAAAAPAAGAAGTEAAPAEAAEADWKLLLVNPWNTLPEDFSVELVTLASCGLKVDKRIFEDLEEMLVACREAGLRPLICSAYRTEAVQTRLYNNKIARLRAAGYGRESAVKEAGRWVAVPNTSEHQTGLALDIVSAGYQGLTKRQERTAEQQWLMEHCWEYGFILRYPSEKSEITGIGYEPWHYRYVGKETALAMRDSGQCLEEYLEALESPTA